jgi:hypothetical protein
MKVAVLKSLHDAIAVHLAHCGVVVRTGRDVSEETGAEQGRRRRRDTDAEEEAEEHRRR